MSDVERWVENSVNLGFNDSDRFILYFSIVIGCLILAHSHYINRNKFSIVRIWNDIAAFSLALQGVVILLVLSLKMSYGLQIFLVNIVAINIFGLLNQLADNYLTFARYEVVVGKVSKAFKISVFSFIFTTNYIPFFSIGMFLPFFFNIHNDAEYYFVLQIVCFLSYTLFNVFFFTLLIRILIEKYYFTTVDATSNRTKFIIELAFRAALHTFFSIIGLFAGSFYAPSGYIWSSLVVSVSIHCILNWKHKNIFFNKVSHFTESNDLHKDSKHKYISNESKAESHMESHMESRSEIKFQKREQELENKNEII